MKVTILKKIIKEGNTNGRDWKIRSLFVKFDDKEIYDKIINKLVADGADEDSAKKAVKENEYKDEISYVFYLNCSKFTFERVENFGVIDAKIVFPVNDKGYINPRIVVEAGKEQILSYEEPKEFTQEGEEITGWAIKAPDPISESELETESTKTEVIPPMPELTAEGIEDELPF